MTEVREREDRLTRGYKKASSVLTTYISVIALLIGVAVVFIVASLEGTREIKASNSMSGKIMTLWRSHNPDEMFPEEKVDIISYDKKDYYFIIDEVSEEGEILKWYWAYDGGLDYTLKDGKIYVLTAVAGVASIIVSSIGYTSTVRAATETLDFKKSVEYYRKQKEEAAGRTQKIPAFCAYKNEQTYISAKRNIVEDADIDWDFYNSEEFDETKLAEWQLKQLKKIEKIKIIRMTSQDLLQEKDDITTKIRMLPMSQYEHKKRYMTTGAIQKFISVFVSGFTAAFGVVLGNWQLGVIYGSVVLFSYIGAIVVATDSTMTTFRNRYIAKGDYLLEFNNIHSMFDKEETNGNKNNAGDSGNSEKEPICADSSGITENSSPASATISSVTATTIGSTTTQSTTSEITNI